VRTWEPRGPTPEPRPLKRPGGERFDESGPGERLGPVARRSRRLAVVRHDHLSGSDFGLSYVDPSGVEYRQTVMEGFLELLQASGGES